MKPISLDANIYQPATQTHCKQQQGFFQVFDENRLTRDDFLGRVELDRLNTQGIYLSFLNN